MRLLVAVGRLALVGCAAVALIPSLVYIRANGITTAGLALVGLPILLGSLAFLPHRRAVAVPPFVLACEMGYVAGRELLVPREPPGWRFCQGIDCGRGPWWAYLAPESET